MNRWLRTLPLLAVLSSCDRRFNIHGRLAEEPAPADIAGSYRLHATSPSQAALKEMGYATVGSALTLRPDLTFTATGVPGCCVHGWDERTYPFTGGIFEFSGNWKIAESGATYGVALDITKLSGKAEKEPSTPDLEDQRKPPSVIHLELLEDSPMSAGFPIFNGDVAHIAFEKQQIPAEK